ncbi:MAG: hypothetical protein H8D43_04955 [Chloroflexi bacterium]|nr:hypothetical protein [Chloroflexota bacterium]
MTIKQFELFHGAVLTKLVRSDQTRTLRMIETRPGEAWAVYTINDAADLFLKHSASARVLTREPGGFSWQFAFGPEQVSQIHERQASRQVYVGLVCGQSDAKQGKMQICFLHPDELAKLIDFEDASTQSITVRYIPRRKLKVCSGNVGLSVSQNALDQWDVPGS